MYDVAMQLNFVGKKEESLKMFTEVKGTIIWRGFMAEI